MNKTVFQGDGAVRRLLAGDDDLIVDEVLLCIIPVGFFNGKARVLDAGVYCDDHAIKVKLDLIISLFACGGDQPLELEVSRKARAVCDELFHKFNDDQTVRADRIGAGVEGRVVSLDIDLPGSRLFQADPGRKLIIDRAGARSYNIVRDRVCDRQLHSVAGGYLRCRHPLPVHRFGKSDVCKVLPKVDAGCQRRGIGQRRHLRGEQLALQTVLIVLRRCGQAAFVVHMLLHLQHPAYELAVLVIAAVGVGVKNDLLFPTDKLCAHLITAVGVGVGRGFLLAADKYLGVTLFRVDMPALRYRADKHPVLIVAAGVLGAGQYFLGLIACLRVGVLRAFLLPADQSFCDLIALLCVDVPRVNMRRTFFQPAGRLLRDRITGIVMHMPLALFQPADKSACLLIAGGRVGVGLYLFQRADQGPVFPVTGSVMCVDDKICITANDVARFVIATVCMGMQLQLTFQHFIALFQGNGRHHH